MMTGSFLCGVGGPVLLVVSAMTASVSARTPGLPAGKVLNQDEIDRHIGRMGDVEMPSDDFAFSAAEHKLWLSNHLENIKQPTQLRYEFIKRGRLEKGFSDVVYLNVLEINADGSKNADMQFFSGERKQNFSPENVRNITGNPVLGIYMQGDVYEMARLTEGSWRHFHKRIKIALHEVAEVQTITISFSEQELRAEKIVFTPYSQDPYRSRFRDLADKRYEITLSNKVPGTLYQIRTVVTAPQEGAATALPLVEEVLTLVDARALPDQ